MSNASTYDNYIAGSWVATQQYTENINPSDTSDVVGQYAVGSVADVEQAVAAARGAQPGWASAGIQQRSTILATAARLMDARAEELGDLLAR